MAATKATLLGMLQYRLPCTLRQQPATRGEAMRHTYLTSKIDVAHLHIKDDDLRFFVSMMSRTVVPDVSCTLIPHELTNAPLLMIVWVFLVSVTDVK